MWIWTRFVLDSNFMTTAEIIATGIRGVGLCGSGMEIPWAITASGVEGKWVAQ